jgi:restriction system protein
VPLDNVVVSRAGIAYGTPYGPALQQGTVNANDVARIVVKLPVGSEVWYLAAIPATGVAGWINSNLIDLPASDVNQITPVSGEAPFAVVRNGGNVRSAPGGEVLRQVEAGLNVRLVERTSDSAWFKIEITPGETGWVSGQLLTINPSVLAGVAVAP